VTRKRGPEHLETSINYSFTSKEEENGMIVLFPLLALMHLLEEGKETPALDLGKDASGRSSNPIIDPYRVLTANIRILELHFLRLCALGGGVPSSHEEEARVADNENSRAEGGRNHS